MVPSSNEIKPQTTNLDIIKEHKTDKETKIVNHRVEACFIIDNEKNNRYILSH